MNEEGTVKTPLIRVFNPVLRRVESFLAIKPVITIGSGASADLQITMPSLNSEHITIDFDKSTVIPQGTDIVLDDHLLGVDPCAFKDGDILHIRAITMGIYTSARNAAEQIERLYKIGSDKITNVSADAPRILHPGPKVGADAPQGSRIVYPKGFDTLHCPCAVQDVNEDNVVDQEKLKEEFDANAFGDQGEPRAESRNEPRNEPENEPKTGTKKDKKGDARKEAQKGQKGDSPMYDDALVDQKLQSIANENDEVIGRKMRAAYEKGLGDIAKLGPLEDEKSDVKRIKLDDKSHGKAGPGNAKSGRGEEEELGAGAAAGEPRPGGKAGGLDGAPAQGGINQGYAAQEEKDSGSSPEIKLAQEVSDEIKNNFGVEPQADAVRSAIDRRIDSANENINEIINKDYNTRVKKPQLGNLGKQVVNKSILEGAKDKVEEAMPADILHSSGSSHSSSMELDVELLKQDISNNIKETIRETVDEAVTKEVRENLPNVVTDVLKSSDMAEALAQLIKPSDSQEAAAREKSMKSEKPFRGKSADETTAAAPTPKKESPAKPRRGKKEAASEASSAAPPKKKAETKKEAGAKKETEARPAEKVKRSAAVATNPPAKKAKAPAKKK